MPILTALTPPILVLVLLMTVAGTRKVLKNRSVEGIALSSITLSLYCALSWIVYGIANGNGVQIAANVLAATGFAIVLGIAHLTGVFKATKVLTGLAAYAAVAGVLVSLVGLAGLGLAVSILTFVTKLPQTRKAWREPGGEGISAAAQAFDATQCAMWVVIGFVIGDIWTISTSLYCLANAAFVAIRTATAEQGSEQRSPALALAAA